MSAAPCESCGEPMSASAVSCPHCGHAHAARDPRDPALAAASRAKPDSRLSAGEAAALLQREPVERSFWRDFLLPNPRLVGGWILVDLALVVLSIPLLLGLAVGIFASEDRGSVSGLLVENVLVALLGGVVFVLVAWELDLFAMGVTAVAIAYAALALRVVLRLCG